MTDPTPHRRSVLLLGSTGSIGTQALDVVAANPDRFHVVGLAAGGADPAALAAQAIRFKVAAVAVSRATAAEDVQLALYAEASRRGYERGNFTLPRILTGPRAALELIATTPADVVLNAVTGSLGLEPTLHALATGATLALANKESLIAGGPLVLRAAAPGQIVPVDSEHSAIAQCLRGGSAAEVARLVITASGGPFRGRRADELAGVTVEAALAHPTWAMGPVVTINSATLVNKGLELIEAHLLFGVPYERIDVVVHPQSIVHSMVTFTDGSTLAQASPPDMRLPISLALGWPDRIAEAALPCEFGAPAAWTFEPLDHDTFPAVRLARQAGASGGMLPAVYNAANEEAVEAFRQGHARFTDIVDTVSRVLDDADGWRADPHDVEEVLAAERWARAHARELLAATADSVRLGRDCPLLAFIIGVVLFALGICLSVALHEAGHMYAAKAFGMKVRRYFIGFGPKIFSFRRGETEYGLKAIPLGGFCDIAGMTALDEVTPEESERAMWRYPAWKRVVVMIAGSVTHFILGFIVLYLMATSMGLPNIAGTPVISATDCAAATQNPRTFEYSPCTPSDPAPARDAGIQPGDEIISIDGQRTPTWTDVVTKVKDLRGEHTFVINRDGAERSVVVDIPVVQRVAADATLGSDNNQTVTVGAIGVRSTPVYTYGALGAFGGAATFTGDMFVRTWEGLLAFPQKIPKVIEAIGGGERDPDTPVSVVGASIIGGDAVEAGVWELFLLLLAGLNFFVGMFNLLPLLPLDGGHIAVTLYEKVRDWVLKLRGKPAGGPVDYTKLTSITMVVVLIGGAVVLLTVTADLVNPIRIGQ